MNAKSYHDGLWPQAAVLEGGRRPRTDRGSKKFSPSQAATFGRAVRQDFRLMVAERGAQQISAITVAHLNQNHYSIS
jgi:hypothetical protein